jgi:hypothetical protein
MKRDYRQFAGGQPQQMPFQVQGYAPQGMQQQGPALAQALMRWK